MHCHHRIEFAATIPAPQPNGFSALSAVDLTRMLLVRNSFPQHANGAPNGRWLSWTETRAGCAELVLGQPREIKKYYYSHAMNFFSFFFSFEPSSFFEPYSA